eukprot:scaffold1488_cov141-Amphora_coffeaeformis.AAC.1
MAAEWAEEEEETPATTFEQNLSDRWRNESSYDDDSSQSSHDSILFRKAPGTSEEAIIVSRQMIHSTTRPASVERAFFTTVGNREVNWFQGKIGFRFHLGVVPGIELRNWVIVSAVGRNATIRESIIGCIKQHHSLEGSGWHKKRFGENSLGMRHPVGLPYELHSTHRARIVPKRY